MSEGNKPQMTPAQKRLLRLVYTMGAVMVVLFVTVLGAIVWKIIHHS